MSVQVSRFIRLALLDRMGIFNSLVDEACGEFGIESYHINFAREDGQPQNFYEGNRTIDALNLYQEPEFPALTFWIAEGLQYPPGSRTQGTVFSGTVSAHWRFFLSVKGKNAVGLIDLREATESALMATLDEELGGFNYRGDLAWQPLPEQIWVDQDQNHVGFIQEIEFAASFEVNIT